MNLKKEVEPRVQVGESELEPFVARVKGLIGSRSVREFARIAGVPEATLRATLNGSEPSRPLLIALARAGGVTIDWLATGIEMPAARPGSEFDRELMRAIIEGMEEGLAASGEAPRPASKAQFVLGIYDLLHGKQIEDPKALVMRLYVNDSRNREGFLGGDGETEDADASE